MIFSVDEQQKVIDRYTEKYSKFGYSQKTLGWDKGKQDIRFDILTSTWNFEDKTILDIGCGFGDLYKFLNEKFEKISYYKGIDLVPKLIEEGNKLYSQNNNFNLEVANFLKWETDKNYDYVLISGIFNFKIEENNLDFIKAILTKAFKIANIGVASNFLSDKVEYELLHAYHSNPLDILNIAYGLTNNIVFRNDYFPFEFSIFLDKRIEFLKEDTIFLSYKKNYE